MGLPAPAWKRRCWPHGENTPDAPIKHQVEDGEGLAILWRLCIVALATGMGHNRDLKQQEPILMSTHRPRLLSPWRVLDVHHGPWRVLDVHTSAFPWREFDVDTSPPPFVAMAQGPEWYTSCS